MFLNTVFLQLQLLLACMAKQIPPDDEPFPDSNYNLPHELIIFLLATLLSVLVVAVVVATLSQSSLSDSDFEDVVEEQAPADAVNERVARGKSKNGKLAHGKDAHWIEVEVFENAQEFFASNTNKKLKEEFIGSSQIRVGRNIFMRRIMGNQK